MAIPSVLMPEIEQIAYAGILLAMAMVNEKGGKVYPAGGNIRFRDSMTLDLMGNILLWYNVESGSTSIVRVKRS